MSVPMNFCTLRSRFLVSGVTNDTANPPAPRAAGTADAVHVVFGHDGQVVVDDVVDLGYVDAAGQDVGRHDHVHAAVAEGVERTAALRLAAVGMDRFGGNADALQTAGAVVCAALGLGEDDDARTALFFNKGVQKLGLLTTRGVDDVLVHLVGGLAALGDFDDFGVVEHREHGLVLAAVDRCREQQRLTRVGRRLYKLLDLGPKAHVEQAVGLVEHENLHFVQVQRAALHEVDQASGRADRHVQAAFELLDLSVVCDAAQEDAHEVVGVLADGHAGVCDLARQLAGRGDDQHEGTAFASLAVGKGVHGRQRERGGLAGAGLGGGDYVAAFEGQRNGAFLNRGGIGVSQGLDGGEGVFGQSEFGESSYDGLLKSCFERQAWRRAYRDVRAAALRLHGCFVRRFLQNGFQAR